MNFLIDRLQKIPMFQNTNKESLRWVNKRYFRPFKRDERIIRTHDPVTGLYIILDGTVEAYLEQPDGSDSPVAIWTPYEVIGLALLFSKRTRYTISVRALNQVETLFVPIQAMEQMLNTDPVFVRNFIELISTRLVQFTHLNVILAKTHVRQRIVSYLYFLLNEDISSAQEVELPYTKEAIAKLIGIPRPSLSRELCAMQEEGLIEMDGRKIKIIRPEALFNQL